MSVKGVNGRCIAQLRSLQNVGHVAPLPLAQFAAKRAREYAHVITGDLQRSIEAKKTGANTAEVVATMPYAMYEEFGTRYRPAHPYLRAAMADAAVHLPEMSAKEVNAEIRRRVNRA
jgi:HK97 gp10 family phage protein